VKGELKIIPSMDPNISRILSLPRELLRSFLNSIINFEPWTYSVASDRAEVSITEADLLLYLRDAIALNYTPSKRYVLGLSSESGWVLSILSRHPYRLSRSAMGGISSAVTQALRRINAQLERSHWEGRGPNSISHVPAALGIAGPDIIDPENARLVPRELYSATVETEEEAHRMEIPTIRSVRAAEAADNPYLSTALIPYDPTPVLKLSAMDIAHLLHRQDIPEVASQPTAILILVLMALAQYRHAFLLALEKLERDNPIPSIEHYEQTPSPWLDRLRSMSGSTVAEAYSREEVLSFSMVSTVYDSSAVEKEAMKNVRWAEKRESEEKDTGKEAKRPKLSEYKQVSSGRVATLMDRFERFHI
jgi:hypothetical protein